MDKFIRTLERRDTVSQEEKSLLAQLRSRERSFDAREEVVAEGSRPTSSLLLTEGFACRAKTLANGKRQITAIHIAGDYVDLHSYLLKKMDHSVIAITPCKFIVTDHTSVKRLLESSEHLTRLLWLMTIIDAATHREWITSMGRRSSMAHLAQLFCELYVKCEIVGLTEGYSYNFPLTQAELGDVLGLSVVHVNRTLQDLRAEGVIQWEDRMVTILNWQRLQRLADFDPTYLNLNQEPR